jgi:cytochrome c-type biogenesis protein CcmE
VSEVAETAGPTGAQPRRHVRLVIALVVASLLGTFAVYTAFAGSSMPIIGVAVAASGEHGDRTVKLTGKVQEASGDASSQGGLRFVLRDYTGAETVNVVYHGSVPDAFRVGREVVIDGNMEDGVFIAKRDTLVTKCPSKYQERPSSEGAQPS